MNRPPPTVLFQPKVLAISLMVICPIICTSAAAQESDPVLYLAGDIADCRETPAPQSAAAKTAKIITERLKQNPQAKVITLGDNTYPNGELKEFNDCYAPTWGAFRQQTHPSPGNHEYRTPDAGGYFQYFAERAGPEQRGYYRWQFGKWRIFSLHSYLKAPEKQAAQLAWLKKELASTPAGCTLAYWHHPLFSSGGHGNNNHMREIWDVLQAAKADLILSGHDHDYERFAPQDGQGIANKNGMREFVVGTGGTPLTPFLVKKPNSEAADNSSHGVLQLVLREHSYEWAFLSVEPGGFSDKGSAICH